MTIKTENTITFGLGAIVGREKFVITKPWCYKVDDVQKSKMFCFKAHTVVVSFDGKLDLFHLG